jgi:hypothetical protein
MATDKTPDPDFVGEQLAYLDTPDAAGNRTIPSYQDDLKRMETSKVDNLMSFADTVFVRCLALARRKNADYAGAADPLKNFRRHGSYGVAVRLDDKICRVATLLESGKDPQVNDESVEDTCLDIINYAWILLRLRRDGQ